MQAEAARAERKADEQACVEAGEAPSPEDLDDDPRDVSYIYASDSSQGDSDSQDEEAAPLRYSLHASRRELLPEGFLPVNPTHTFCDVQLLTALDDDNGEARAVDRARFGPMHDALVQGPLSDTQRTKGRGSNSTVQAELGFFATANGGAHMNLLEISRGGEPVAVTESHLRSLSPLEAADLKAKPAPREHSCTFARLRDPNIAAHVRRTLRRDHSSNEDLRTAKAEASLGSSSSSDSMLLRDACDRHTNQQLATASVLFPLSRGTMVSGSGSAEHELKSEACAPTPTLIEEVLESVGAHAVALETHEIDGQHVPCLRVDPSVAREVLVAQLPAASEAGFDPHKMLMRMTADEAAQLEVAVAQLERLTALTLSITAVVTHLVAPGKPKVAYRVATIARTPTSVLEALRRIDRGTRTLLGYHLLQRPQVDALIKAALMPLGSDVIQYVHSNRSRSTIPPFAKRCTAAELLALCGQPINRVQFEMLRAPRSVRMAANDDDDEDGDDGSGLATQPSGFRAAFAPPSDAAEREGTDVATRLVSVMMGPRDATIPGTGTADALLLSMLGPISLKAGIDAHKADAAEGSLQRELARLSERRRGQLAASGYSPLDGKAAIMRKVLRAAAAACPDGLGGDDAEAHQLHCQALLHAALMVFPMHASIAAKALSAPACDLPTLTDACGRQLHLPTGLATLGDAVVSPGAAPGVEIKLALSLAFACDRGGHTVVVVKAAIATVAAAPVADRVIALHMLRALSNKRIKEKLSSVHMNRMNMSFYSLRLAVATHESVCNASFQSDAGLAELHAFLESLPGWPPLASSRALLYCVGGAPGVLSRPFRDADMPAQPGTGFDRGVLGVLAGMVPTRALALAA